MRSRIGRRGFVAALFSGLVIIGTAQAADPVIIDFATPGTVVAGQNVQASVQVNQVPMSVTFTSNPPGLASYTTTVTATTQTVAVPTNSAAPAGSYTLTATPTAGGVSKSAGVLASRPGGGN